MKTFIRTHLLQIKIKQNYKNNIIKIAIYFKLRKEI